MKLVIYRTISEAIGELELSKSDLQSQIHIIDQAVLQLNQRANEGNFDQWLETFLSMKEGTQYVPPNRPDPIKSLVAEFLGEEFNSDAKTCPRDSLTIMDYMNYI